MILSVIILFTVGAVYSFFQLNTAEKKSTFNLYSLVPEDATAVVETGHMADLVKEIEALPCSKDNHFLYISDLFVYLKSYLLELVDDTPHGLSTEMNKMLLSFHEPDSPLNQVLYCTLGEGDHELVESFVRKYAGGEFSPRTLKYAGEEIRIYPMEQGRFLAAYFTSDFLVLSFQMHLIERVIDALSDKKSLLEQEAFRAIYDGSRKHVSATVYVRMRDVEMGKESDTINSQARLGNWVEFDLKLDERAIYCSGITHDTDTTQNFFNALRKQEPISVFAGHCLPSSTFFYNSLAISDREAIFGFMAQQAYHALPGLSDSVRERDEACLTFLDEHAAGHAMTCFFQPEEKDTLSPCVVLCVPLKDEWAAEKQLQAYLSEYYPQDWAGRRYVLPYNTLLAQMTGVVKRAAHTYVAFYQGMLLLAPDIESLTAYIHALDAGDVLDGRPLYEETVSGLSSYYNFMMSIEMEKMLHQSEEYVRLVPKYFFRHAKFFRHFLISMQFTCTDGVVYPNIVLLYNGE